MNTGAGEAQEQLGVGPTVGEETGVSGLDIPRPPPVHHGSYRTTQGHALLKYHPKNGGTRLKRPTPRHRPNTKALEDKGCVLRWKCHQNQRVFVDIEELSMKRAVVPVVLENSTGSPLC